MMKTVAGILGALGIFAATGCQTSATGELEWADPVIENPDLVPKDRLTAPNTCAATKWWEQQVWYHHCPAKVAGVGANPNSIPNAAKCPANACPANNTCDALNNCCVPTASIPAIANNTVVSRWIVRDVTDAPGCNACPDSPPGVNTTAGSNKAWFGVPKSSTNDTNWDAQTEMAVCIDPKPAGKRRCIYRYNRKFDATCSRPHQGGAGVPSGPYEGASKSKGGIPEAFCPVTSTAKCPNAAAQDCWQLVQNIAP